MEWGVLGISTAILVVAVISWVSRNFASPEHRNRESSNALIRHHGVDPTQGLLPLSDRVKQMAVDPGRKIEAIIAYREETGAGLAEAKEAIESFANGK